MSRLASLVRRTVVSGTVDSVLRVVFVAQQHCKQQADQYELLVLQAQSYR